MNSDIDVICRTMVCVSDYFKNIFHQNGNRNFGTEIVTLPVK